MTSPAKRRKKNDYNGSNPPARGLDYFFGKQKAAATQSLPHRPDDKDKLKPTTEDSGDVEKDEDNSALTDEELARKLQEQWDREDAAQRAEASATTDLAKDRIEPASAPTDESSKHDKVPPSTPPPQAANQGSEHSTPAKPQTLSLQSASAIEETASSSIPFDESPLTFEPSKYIPALQEAWFLEGGNSTYALLTRCFILVNSTQSRIKIVDTLVNAIRTIIESDPDSLLPAVWLATNSISPPYIDLELGLGGSAISKALMKVCGLNNAGLKSLYNKYGDAGDVAFEAKKRQTFTLRKPKPLTIKGVFDSLVKIANSKGQGSQETKQRIVEKLVQDARGAEESRYVVRTLVQHLRIGAVKTTMLIALSRAFLLSRPKGASFSVSDPAELRKLKKDELTAIYSRGEEIVKACFARRPNYNDLIPVLLSIGVSEELLLRCGLSMHIPLRPMLGAITRDLQEMLVKLQNRDFVCEYKYDGQRAQVHCDENGKVTIFSRHLEVMTDKYPDLVALVPKIRGDGVSSFILEGEVVAIDPNSGDLKTFQTLANRARKDVIIHDVTITVCLFAFDLMYLNGEELLSRPFRERRELLKSLFVEIPYHFTWVKSLEATSEDAEAVQEFFKNALENKCEGIMVKVLDNPSKSEIDAIEDENASDKDEAEPTTPKKKKSKASSKAKVVVEKPKKSGRRKALLATYEPDKRLDSWLKVKKDYDSASADTLDLIPIAGWHGQGRKSKWWSPVLLAVRNPETGALQAVTKCMSGFSDKFYIEMRKKYDPDVGAGDSDDEEEKTADTAENDEAKPPTLKNNTLPGQPSYVEYSAGHPNVWFNPQEVWECAFADITLSPTYTAAIGLVSEERGLSLRFPRFLKVREDKSIEEASDSDFLASLWRKQEGRGAAAEAEGDQWDEE